MTVGGRIYLKKDNSGLELVKAFAKIPTANIADTMGRSCAMHPRIKLFSSPHGTVWAGIALTVKSRGGDNLLIHAALDMAREGDVIVVSNEGGVDNRSLMGEIMFTYAAYKKLNGLVLDGPIRDVKSAKEIPLPIYATGSTPGGPYKEGPGEINVPISCGGISVNPGDIVVMDDDGVTLKKITGTINILIIFINRSPAGFTQIEKSWKNSPAIIPMIKQTPTLCGKYFLFNKNVLILSPRFPNNLLY